MKGDTILLGYGIEGRWDEMILYALDLPPAYRIGVFIRAKR
jgi:hypothetical protein